MDVVEDGRVKQRRALGRIFNEPDPIEGNLSDGEIVEQGEEEVIFPITRKTPKLHMDSVENGRILETADFWNRLLVQLFITNVHKTILEFNINLKHAKPASFIAIEISWQDGIDKFY